MARFLTALRSAHSQKTPWIFDQNNIYLFLPEAPGPHHGNDVSEYMTVPLAAVAPEPGQVANVLGDEYLSQMAPIDEGPDDRQAAGVVGHVNRCKRIKPRLQAEKVQRRLWGSGPSAGVRERERDPIPRPGSVPKRSVYHRRHGWFARPSLRKS